MTNKPINKSEHIAMNTIILFIRMFVITIINLYTVRLVLKGLGVIDYGLFNAVAGVVTTTSFISSILELSIQRFYSVALGKNDTASLAKIFSISLKISIFLCLIVLAVFETGGIWFISNKLTVPEMRINATYFCFHFSLIAFIFSLLQIPFSAAIFSHEEMNVYAVISSIDCILKLIVSAMIGFTAFDNLSFYSFGMFSVALITFLNYSLYSHIKYPECSYRKTKDINLTKSILSFSGWTMFGSIAKVCMIQGSTILLNIFYGPIANAAFAISMQINNAFNALCNSMVLAVRPAMIKAYSNNAKEYLYKTFNFSNKFLLYVLIAVSFPMIANMQTILKLWLHETTAQTTMFAQLTIVYIIVLAMNNPITIIVQASGKIKTYFLSVESVSLLCLPVSYIAFKQGLSSYWIFYSMIGVCAIAHIIRLISLKGIFDLFKYRDYIFGLCVPAFFICLLGILVEYGISSILQHHELIHLIASGITLPIVILVSSFLIGLSKEEKVAVIGIIRSRIKKN